jgi:hypothetical protein
VDTNPSLLYRRRHRDDLFEVLPENPWIKFRPRTWINPHGNHGRDFVNAWTTDERGFKNEVSERRSSFVAVALGDSFTEGAGLPAADAWPALVSRAGFPVYSLGVQGYAPTQIAGAYARYGAPLHAPIVIFGYTPGFEKREFNFLERERPPTHRWYTGGIQAIYDALHEERVKYPYFKITNTGLHFLKEAMRAPLTRIADRIRDPARAGSRFTRYRDSVMKAAADRRDMRGLEFERTREALLSVKQTADRRGQKVVVLLYTLRPWAYYARVTGRDPPADHLESVVSAMVRDFCRKNGMDLIDTHEAVKRTMDGLSDAGDLSDLPYFEIDGQHNAVGNRIVAEEVLKYLKNKTLRNWVDDKPN